jgi:hypothetical protein
LALRGGFFRWTAVRRFTGRSSSGGPPPPPPGASPPDDPPPETAAVELIAGAAASAAAGRKKRGNKTEKPTRVRRTRKAEARKVRRGVESKGKTCLTFLPVQKVCVHGFPKLVVVAQLPTLLILDRFRASPQLQSRSQFLLFGLFGTKSRRMRATRKKETPSPAGSKATTVRGGPRRGRRENDGDEKIRRIASFFSRRRPAKIRRAPGSFSLVGHLPSQRHRTGTFSTRGST